MTAGLRVWLQVGSGTAVAILLSLVLSPASPTVRASLGAALAAGALAGLTVYLAVARTRPRLPRRRAGVAVAAGKYALLGVLAANEELVWRRIVLGELLGTSPVAAVAASTLFFAVAHRARPALHLVTGATFGALYAATGVLAASIAAHLTYNSLLATLAERCGAES